MAESIKVGNADIYSAFNTNLMKIIVNHFIILNLIISLPIEYPSEIKNFFSTFLTLSFINTPSSEIYSLDCFLRDINWQYASSHYILLKSILSYFFLLILFLVVSFL